MFVMEEITYEYLEIVYLQIISTQQNWDEILVNLNY